MSLLTLASPNFRNQSRRRFKADFKQQVVQYLLRSGATVAEVARIYEVHPNQLCRWRTEYRKQMGPSDPVAPTVTLLPVNLASSEPTESTNSAVVSTPAATHGSCLTIAVSKGNIRAMPGCPAELLRIAIEALR